MFTEIMRVERLDINLAKNYQGDIGDRLMSMFRIEDEGILRKTAYPVERYRVNGGEWQYVDDSYLFAYALLLQEPNGEFKHSVEFLRVNGKQSASRIEGQCITEASPNAVGYGGVWNHADTWLNQVCVVTLNVESAICLSGLGFRTVFLQHDILPEHWETKLSCWQPGSELYENGKHVIVPLFNSDTSDGIEKLDRLSMMTGYPFIECSLGRTLGSYKPTKHNPHMKEENDSAFRALFREITEGIFLATQMSNVERIGNGEQQE